MFNKVRNPKGNPHATRSRIPDDEKERVTPIIVEGILHGKSRAALAIELGLSWHTVDKYFEEGMVALPGVQDTKVLVKREVTRMERALDKATADYHAGKCKVTDFVAASAHYCKYSGIDRAIEVVTAAAQPDLLNVAVHQVEVEMPLKPIENEAITNISENQQQQY
jgi:hypothetical protein